MKMKNLILLSIVLGGYYFLHSLGTTNKITDVNKESVETIATENYIKEEKK